MTSSRPRVLLAITVYNGRSFVPRCLRSAMRLDRSTADIDVLVLDDASPEPGFSEMLASLCTELGAHYYLTPRNLGIVRNVNLGLLAALENAYDHVVISNSDVVYSRTTITRLLDAAASSPGIGSVTAWSNNVSIFSIPNRDPDALISGQETIDWLAASLDGAFRGVAIDVPAGISFCMLIPTPVLRVVGLMDPIFGRGYCEETDWSLRSLSLGYRVTLAPSAFVYHQGRGSTVAAGLVSGGHTTVPANEAIIDYRFPLFRQQVDAFIRGGVLSELHESGISLILRAAAAQFGHRVWFDSHVRDSADSALVDCSVSPSGDSIVLRMRGFELSLRTAGKSPAEVLAAFFAGAPAARAASTVAPSREMIGDENVRSYYPPSL